MVKKAVQHVHDNTPHKDRLVLTGLVAVLAFSVINTFVSIASLEIAQSGLAVAG